MIAEPIMALGEQALAQATSNDSEVVISARNVSKMYRIYDKPQDRLKQMLFWRFGKSYGHEFWAVRNVSFEVRKGETVGIVGRNGSGKSTLLQMIAGTLAPTEGDVQVRGRIAALLELGSGFNPEFTGRENVYLNGAILGLTPAEIDAIYDDIVAFADIGEFINQPVKVYSSGMVVRLAFAVQAQVSPDILIVDEALAVGDFAFQHKCMSKLKSLQQQGVSILFVSHDIGSIKAHCSKAIMLEHGHVYSAGDPDEVCVTYLHSMIDQHRQKPSIDETIPSSIDTELTAINAINSEKQANDLEQMMPINASTREGTGDIRYQGIQIRNIHGEVTSLFRFGDWAVIEVIMRAEKDVASCYPGFLIKDLYGNYLTGMTTWALGQPMPPLMKGEYFKVVFSVQLLYRKGNYSILINNCIDTIGTDFYDWCDNVAQFTILEGDALKPEYGYGLFCPPIRVQLYSGKN